MSFSVCSASLPDLPLLGGSVLWASSVLYSFSLKWPHLKGPPSGAQPRLGEVSLFWIPVGFLADPVLMCKPSLPQ